MSRALRPDGTLALTADDIDRAAQSHVEGRFFPREKHGKLYDTSLGRSHIPASAASLAHTAKESASTDTEAQ